MRDFIDFRHFVQLKWCNSILRFFHGYKPGMLNGYAPEYAAFFVMVLQFCMIVLLSYDNKDLHRDRAKYVTVRN